MIDRQVIGPYDMEQELGLIGGNIFHGELSVDQLFHMRPAPGYADYRTPLGACTTVPAPPTAAGGERDPRLAGVRVAAKDQALSGRRSDVGPDDETGAPRPAHAGGPSVAVVGASVKEGSLGRQMMAELRRGGFDGASTRSTPATRRSTAYRATRRSSRCPSR